MAMMFSIGGKTGISQTKEEGQSTARTSGNEASKQTTQRLSDSNIADLSALLKTIQGNITGSKEFTREAAIQDSAGIVKELFAQYSQQALPQIISKASQSGAYNSTAAQLLADNAFAETISKSAQVRTNAIAQYAQADATKQQVQTQTLGTILQSLLQAKETTNLDTVLNSVTNSNFTGKTTNLSHQAEGKFGK
jgi:hypothetical protein